MKRPRPSLWPDRCVQRCPSGWFVRARAAVPPPEDHAHQRHVGQRDGGRCQGPSARPGAHWAKGDGRRCASRWPSRAQGGRSYVAAFVRPRRNGGRDSSSCRARARCLHRSWPPGTVVPALDHAALLVVQKVVMPGGAALGLQPAHAPGLQPAEPGVLEGIAVRRLVLHV